MKQFLIICAFAMFSLNGLHAQSSVEVVNTQANVETQVSKETLKDVAAKKKDILTKKIELSINGKVDLFQLKERKIIC